MTLAELEAQEARLLKPIEPGARFGRLMVWGFDHTGAKSEAYYQCRCGCGKHVVVGRGPLIEGRTKSCGCWKAESAAINGRASGATRRTHGLSTTKVYDIRRWMIQRCTLTTHSDYERYGGRGIRVCDEWLASFEGFYDHVSRLPHFDLQRQGPDPGHSLDRIDNDGNYGPGNVRWATAREQRANQR